MFSAQKQKLKMIKPTTAAISWTWNCGAWTAKNVQWTHCTQKVALQHKISKTSFLFRDLGASLGSFLCRISPISFIFCLHYCWILHTWFFSTVLRRCRTVKHVTIETFPCRNLKSSRCLFQKYITLFKLLNKQIIYFRKERIV